MTEFDIKLLKKFARLERRKMALKTALDQTEALIDPIRDIVRDHLIDAGVQNIKIDGRTIYINHEVWAKRLGTMEEACKALKEAGLEEYVSEKYVPQSLSAYVREKVKNKEELPKEFEDVIETLHVNKVKSIKA